MAHPNFFIFPHPADGSQLRSKFGEQGKALEDGLNEDFPHLGHNYQILGGFEVKADGQWEILDPAVAYNCLGWVVNRQENMSSNRTYWNDTGIATACKILWSIYIRASITDRNIKLTLCTTVSAIGLQEVAEDRSLVDVWYGPKGKPCHVSKRNSLNETQWTSKLGPQGPLIQHARNALAGPIYGTVRRHFGRPPSPAPTTTHTEPHALAMDVSAVHEEAAEEPASAEEVETVRAHALLAVAVKGKSPSRPPFKPHKPALPGKPPAKTGPPTSTIPKNPHTKPPTTAKPPPKGTNPAKPGTNPQTGDANFEKYFEAWKKTWTKPPAMFIST